MNLNKIGSALKLDKLHNFATSSAGRTMLKVQKSSPEIMLGAGVVGVFGATVLACKATLKVDTVLDDAKAKMEKIARARDIAPDEYSHMNSVRDKTLVMIQTGIGLTKLYLPSIVVGGLSIYAIVGSHNIMKARNAGLAAAYTALDKAYSGYRQRVIDEYGEEKDKDYRYGLEDHRQAYKDDEGNERHRTVKREHKSRTGYSPYAALFDETTSACWRPDADRNAMFLKAQCAWANDKLTANGHLFLNEVYDMLGLPRTSAGAVVGWVRDGKATGGDGFVDFGLYNPTNDRAEAFLQGHEKSVWLDFNVDGLIYEMI